MTTHLRVIVRFVIKLKTIVLCVDDEKLSEGRMGESSECILARIKEQLTIPVYQSPIYQLLIYRQYLQR